MIRESSTSRGAKGPQQQGQVQVDGIMARSHVGLGTDFTRFVNQFHWATNQLLGTRLGRIFGPKNRVDLGPKKWRLPGPNSHATGRNSAGTLLGLVITLLGQFAQEMLAYRDLC